MGYIVKKNINGKEYYYRRVKIGKECTETYVSSDSVDSVRKQIIKRRELEKRLKDLEKIQPFHMGEFTTDATNFVTDIVIGQELSELVSHFAFLKKRDAVERVREYLQSDCVDKVFLLCGLSGAGNTTIMLQTIAEMDEESFGGSAYLRIKTSDNFVRLNRDMRLLRRLGFKYIFVDNVTAMKDFITGAGVFSDLFGGYGLKFVITGSDSLSVMLTENGELWHSCVLLNTTYIPYRESKDVLGIGSIDEYMCGGGTMFPDIVKSRNLLLPYNKEATENYVNRAVAKNLETSLCNRKLDGDFGFLEDLHEQNQLMNAVCRFAENLSVKSVGQFLEHKYMSEECRDCRSIISKMLDNLNSDIYRSPISEDTMADIEDWLFYMGFVEEIKVVNLSDLNVKDSRIVFTQPWVAYSYAIDLTERLISDSILFCGGERALADQTVEWIREAMMKDIVLLETARARSDISVSVLQSDDIGVDMVVRYDDVGSCGIYRIIYGDEICPDGFGLSDDARQKIESVFGNVSERYIVYRGETADKNGVHCVNVEEYLESL
ncbi:MAG: hypothetical protein LUD47_02885 [Clostridia bacterium]|nr:hypothetical protein [Clostridia bacterium]